MVNKEIMIHRLEKLILFEFNRLDKLPMQESFSQKQVLFNVFKILQNYDDLEPVLKKYFAEKSKKEKLDKGEER